MAKNIRKQKREELNNLKILKDASPEMIQELELRIEKVEREFLQAKSDEEKARLKSILTQYQYILVNMKEKAVNAEKDINEIQSYLEKKE